MNRLAELRILAPLSNGWRRRGTTSGAVERLRAARYRVSVAVPAHGRPMIKTRIMRGWELQDYIRLHSGELAEFIVSVVPFTES